jgi:hypothetical protein
MGRVEAQCARFFGTFCALARVSETLFLAISPAHFFNIARIRAPHPLNSNPATRDLGPVEALNAGGRTRGNKEEMVGPKRHLVRCVGRALNHGRAFHTIPSSQTPKQSSIAHLLDNGPPDSENVVINGFIRSIRNQKQRSFASVGDGSSLEPLQAILTPAQAQRSDPIPVYQNTTIDNLAGSLTTGTAVRFTGSWQPSPNPKAQSHELHVAEVDIIGPADPAVCKDADQRYSRIKADAIILDVPIAKEIPHP